MDGSDWVELFVREMSCVSNMDDAKARASRALEVLEKSIRERAGAEAVRSFQQVGYHQFCKINWPSCVYIRVHFLFVAGRVRPWSFVNFCRLLL